MQCKNWDRRTLFLIYLRWQQYYNITRGLWGRKLFLQNNTNPLRLFVSSSEIKKFISNSFWRKSLHCAIRISAQGVNHEQLLTKKCKYVLYNTAWADHLFIMWWYPKHFLLPPCYFKGSKERQVSSDFGMPYSDSS